jgi:transposase
MAGTDLLPPLGDLKVLSATVDDDLVFVSAATTSQEAACPVCGFRSQSVHSRYARTLADLPWQGRRVQIRLVVRRFRCLIGDCPRKVFCERLADAAQPHARTTGRLTDAHTAVGTALGGEAGSRLCQRLAAPTSPDTLLRRIKSLPRPSHPTPRVLGVDDFAFRRRHTYGTILIDLERRCVVDLLPDRETNTLVRWLEQRPGVEIVSRDRASAYSQAVNAVVPGATQVADRFHLLVNLREAMEQAFQRNAGAVRAALDGLKTPPTMNEPPPVQPLNPRRGASLVDRQSRFDRVRTLHREGRSLRSIARELQLHYRTVERYVRAEALPTWGAGAHRSSRLDRHADFLRERLQRDGPTATQLHCELASRGCRCSGSVLRQYVRRLRSELQMPPRRPSRPITAVPVSRPSARRLAIAVLRDPSTRNEREAEHMKRLAAADSPLGAAIELAERFAATLRQRRGDGLEDWLQSAERCSSLQPFAADVRRDLDAVRAGLTLTWSNGPVEGSVNRLKLIKRSGYGRMGFDLLRARVLNAV